MPDYRRAYLKVGTFFFTVVSYKRYPFFKEEAAIDLLWQCFHATMAIYPFRVAAIVILPDHLHTIWTLPSNDPDFSTRWKRIRATFSRHYRGCILEDISESMRRKKEKYIKDHSEIMASIELKDGRDKDHFGHQKEMHFTIKETHNELKTYILRVYVLSEIIKNRGLAPTKA